MLGIAVIGTSGQSSAWPTRGWKETPKPILCDVGLSDATIPPRGMGQVDSAKRSSKVTRGDQISESRSAGK